MKVKQEETSEALQQQGEVGEPGVGLVVPVQNGEGDSLNLSAGFIQVLVSAESSIHTSGSKLSSSLQYRGRKAVWGLRQY